MKPEDRQVIRNVAQLRTTFQKARIASGNRYFAVRQGNDSEEGIRPNERALRWERIFEELEEQALFELHDLVKPLPIYREVIQVKGIGKILAAQLISAIDISRANTPSALWRYAGLAVFDGKAERRIKGEKLHYNMELKKFCFLIGESFVKCRSPYRRIYDEAKEFYAANRPNWTKKHCHMAALRKMVKVFLVHLWIKWRELEGLPVRPIYVLEKMGHTTFISAEEFGWN